MVSLKETTLVQRLTSATDRPSPFAFGGGMPNGGLSSAQRDVLSKAFDFEYMGAYEFECGAVADALENIRGLAVGGTLLASVCKHGNDNIYVLCAKPLKENILARISDILDGNLNLKGELVVDGRTEGWLELDNGFFFFTNKTMWEKTAEIFGVRVGG